MENIWTEQLALIENKRIGKWQKVEFIMANISWLWIVLVNVERIYWRAYEKEETNEHLNRRSSNSLIEIWLKNNLHNLKLQNKNNFNFKEFVAKQ